MELAPTRKDAEPLDSPSLWRRPDPILDYPIDDRAVHNTEIGLLFLVVGFILGPLPVIGFWGVILDIGGAICVIMGRGAFGERHSKYVVISTFVYFFSNVILFFVSLTLLFDIQQAFLTYRTAAELSAAMNNIIGGYVIALAVLAALIGLATVFFTYALQNRVGKFLLWVAFGGSILLASVAFVFLAQMPAAVDQAVATRDLSSIIGIVNQIQSLRLLGIIPAIIYGLAYLNARSRITNGDIPEAMSVIT